MTRSAKIGAAAVALLLSLAGLARAGDFAGFQSIGFSADGSVYAFEEYGIRDGAGFPYSTIYAIDTRKDAYLPGTPIRTSLEDENAGLLEARNQTYGKAMELMQTHALGDNPGVLAAFNPFGEVSPTPDRIRYLPIAVDPPVSAPSTLKLETVDMPATAKCQAMNAEKIAFRLRAVERDGKPVDDLVYEDKSIPDSRACPTGYRFGGVVTFQPQTGDASVQIALILVLSQGFEGQDGRWIAIPVKP